MKYYLSAFVLIYLIGISSVFATPYYNVDSLLRLLDKEVGMQKKYLSEKKLKIEKINRKSHTLNASEDRYSLNYELFHEYQYTNYDSAFNYLEKNLTIATNLQMKEIEKKIKLEKCNLYILYGFFWEAQFLLDQIDRSSLPIPLLKKYYECNLRILYYLLKNNLDQHNGQKYGKLFREYKEKMALLFPDYRDLEYDIRYYFYESEKDDDSLDKLINEAFQSDRSGTALYSLACYWKARRAASQNDPEQQKYYLTLGAISDIRGCLMNSRLTFSLARQFFEEGNIIDAQKYINIAMRQMITSNSEIYKARISQLLYDINTKYEIINGNYQNQLLLFVIMTGILSLFLIVTIGLLLKQIRKKNATQQALMKHHDEQIELNQKLKDLNKTLAQTNHIKEEYIGIFLGMRPYYIDKMEEHRKQISKLLKAGKTNELIEYCKSSKDLEKEVESIHKEFDRMFLSIIPEFVTEFNLLLQEQARIYPKTGEMTIELRIFALIRLGIKDSAHIARHLRYSINTIYNYRSRIKNKSILPKEDFEKAVMKIGVLQKDTIF